MVAKKSLNSNNKQLLGSAMNLGSAMKK